MSWDAMIADELSRRPSALRRRRELSAESKSDLIDRILVADGLRCEWCEAEPGDNDYCAGNGAPHPWAEDRENGEQRL